MAASQEVDPKYNHGWEFFVDSDFAGSDEPQKNRLLKLQQRRLSSSTSMFDKIGSMCFVTLTSASRCMLTLHSTWLMSLPKS